MSGNTRTVNSNDEKPVVTYEGNENHPKTITFNDDKAGKVTYTFQEKIGCEYIYKSDRGGQLYALQKDSNDQFHLVQYNYHKGYGAADIHSN